MDFDIRNPASHSPKLIAGIDALYLHLDIDYGHYTTFYNNILLSGLLSLEKTFDMTSYDYSGQYVWFKINVFDVFNSKSEGDTPNCLDLTLCRIGFKNLNQNDNLYSVFVQFDTVYLNMFGYQNTYNKLKEILFSIGLDVIKTKVSRVDLNTYVFGYDFSDMDYSIFLTKLIKNEKIPYKTENPNIISKRGRTETFTLGTRKSGNVFMRIYDKASELRALSYEKSSLKESLIYSRFKAKYPNEKFSMKHFWNVEFELDREIIKRYNVETIEDLFIKVNDIHYDIMNNRIRHLSEPKQDINNSRIETSYIWNLISENYRLFNGDINPIERLNYKIYRKDEEWLKNRFKEFLEANPDINPKKILDELKNMAKVI